MQLIRRYLLNNRIVLTANLAGQVTRYRSVYQRNINVYRNIDNVLQFEVKNADEKAVSILNTYTPKFKMWDENNTLVAENITGDLTSLQFKSNTAIEGVITSVKLDSGTVIAYLI